jgi:hypothetical protein
VGENFVGNTPEILVPKISIMAILGSWNSSVTIGPLMLVLETTSRVRLTQFANEAGSEPVKFVEPNELLWFKCKSLISVVHRAGG